MLTNKNLYNILPTESFLGLFSRIRRKISYSNVIAMTVSRFGSEFVVHVEKEHDYRFSSPNLKLKIVETLVDCFCKYLSLDSGSTSPRCPSTTTTTSPWRATRPPLTT